MQVNGYMLREAIRRHELRREAVARLFADSLYKFDDEDKPSPQELVAQFLEAEEAIAAIQRVQARYNLAVQITVKGLTLTLLEGVKRVGGAGRVEKLWRSAAGGKDDRYSYNKEMVRGKDEIRATCMISPKDAMGRATAAADFAGALRAAIAAANSNLMEVSSDELAPKLIES